MKQPCLRNHITGAGFEIKKPPSLTAQNMSSLNSAPCHDGLCPSLGHDMQDKTPLHSYFGYDVLTQQQKNN